MAKRESFTLRGKGGKTLLNTPFQFVADHCARALFHDERSVYMIHNANGTQKSIQHYIYGRPQK